LLAFIVFSAFAQDKLPDFSIALDNIFFSNDTPVEGEPVTITAMVKNIGDAANMRDDVEVWFYEGKPEERVFKIKVNAFFGLQPGKVKPVQANWRFRSGTTDVYVIVNPEDADTVVAEKSRENNKAFKTITVTPRTYPKATPEQIDMAIKKAVKWIRSQQGTHTRKCPQCEMVNWQLTPICVICTATLKGLPVDTEKSGVWYFGLSKIQETGLAILTLLSAGVPESDQAVQNGLNFIINEADWNNFDVYDAAIVVTMLVATGNREKYFDRVQFAVNRLIKKQSSVEKGHKMRDDGGWGYSEALADGAHMQYVIYALYVAKQWGIKIPPKVWDKAVGWVRRNQDKESGGWYYNQEQSPFAEGVYGSMTATGIMTLKAAGVPTDDKQIQKGFEWLKKYYTITSNPGAFSWQYYYLLALERAFDMPPKQNTFAGWYEEVANLMVAEQQPDGKWLDLYEQRPTGTGPSDTASYLKDDFSTTCFAILFLTRAVPKPTKLELGITSDGIQFSEASPRAEKSIEIKVTITNSGAEVEGIAEVGFYDGHPEKGGTQIGLIEILLSPSQSNVKASTTWRASDAGLHHIFVKIDPFNKIPEENKDNNIADRDITVGPKSDKPVDEYATLTKEIEKGVFQIGNVIMDTNTREVTAPGKINMPSGIIEYFACAKLGKTHESLMVLDIEPIHLQVALLTLGMKEGSSLRTQGDPRIPKGDPAEIWVEWELADKRFRHRAEDLIYNVRKPLTMVKDDREVILSAVNAPRELIRKLSEMGLQEGVRFRVISGYQAGPLTVAVGNARKTIGRETAEKIMVRAPMQHTNWVFTGARIVGNVFTAQAYKNIIATYRDPDAIFNHPLEGGKDDTTYRVNLEVVPPVGTKVKVIVKQVK